MGVTSEAENTSTLILNYYYYNDKEKEWLQMHNLGFLINKNEQNGLFAKLNKMLFKADLTQQKWLKWTD